MAAARGRSQSILSLVRKVAPLAQECGSGATLPTRTPESGIAGCLFFFGVFFPDMVDSPRHPARQRERERERDLQGGLQMMSQVAGLRPQVGGGETGTEEGERHKIKNLALGCCGLSGSLHDKL